MRSIDGVKPGADDPFRPRPFQGVGRLATLALIAAFAAGPPNAQTASQVTPSSLRPELQRLQGALVFSGQPGLEAPAGAERLSVTLSGVTIEGALPQMRADNRAIETRLTGRPIPVAEIFVAAQDLEAAYAREGFVLARVVLPAQTLRDGDRLRLVVVNGFVERTDLGGVPTPVRGRIDALTRPLVGRPGLTLGVIERRLILAGDTPGVALTSALSTGAQPGGTVLTFDAKYRRLTGFVAADNTLSDELGEWAVTLGFEANNYFRLGEVVYVRFAGHPGDSEDGLGGLFDDQPQMRSIAAGAVFPIGTEGLSFGIEAVQSKTTPEVAGLQTASEFRRLSLRLSYPWIRSRKLDVSTDLIFDIQSEDLEALGPEARLSEDDVRVLRVAANARRSFDSGATLQGRAVVSVGLDAFGARGADAIDPGLSREGADASFTKLELAADYLHPVNEHLAFAVHARAQTSFGDPLVRSEQIGIASFQELSTFDAGTLGGDSGWIVRADVLSPWPVSIPSFPVSRITPYAFAATGALYLEQPTGPEVSTLRASSVGVGVEFSTLLDPSFSTATLTAEYGRAFRDDSEADENRFTLVGSYRF